MLLNYERLNLNAYGDNSDCSNMQNFMLQPSSETKKLLSQLELFAWHPTTDENINNLHLLLFLLLLFVCTFAFTNRGVELETSHSKLRFRSGCDASINIVFV